LRNLITDVPGVLVGHADDARLGSGTTVVLFERPAVAGLAAPGGAPALRDGHLLRPENTVEAVDAFVLSGGSAYGLDAGGGAMAWLAERGRGFKVGAATVPICPTAALFDLTHGGDKAWTRSPYLDFGYAAAAAAREDFALGTAGAGYGGSTFDLKGGLGSASAVSSRGFVVGALAAVNCAGRVTRGTSPHFWAAPYERDGEFGALGEGPPAPDRLDFALTSDLGGATTLAVVVTDAAFDKARMARIAIMASAGFGLSLRPAFGPGDGDIVFAAATARSSVAASPRDLAEIGTLAAECLARAAARGVYAATSFPGAKPSWRDRWGTAIPRRTA
jgi:D-aminopeptidase